MLLYNFENWYMQESLSYVFHSWSQWREEVIHPFSASFTACGVFIWASLFPSKFMHVLRITRLLNYPSPDIVFIQVKMSNYAHLTLLKKCKLREVDPCETQRKHTFSSHTKSYHNNLHQALNR